LESKAERFAWGTGKVSKKWTLLNNKDQNLSTWERQNNASQQVSQQPKDTPRSDINIDVIGDLTDSPVIPVPTLPDINPDLLKDLTDKERRGSFLDLMIDIVAGRANISEVIASKPEVLSQVVSLYTWTWKYMSGMLKGAESSSLYDGFTYRTPSDFKWVSLDKFHNDYMNTQASQTFYTFSKIIGDDLWELKRDAPASAMRYNLLGEKIQSLDIKSQKHLKGNMFLQQLLIKWEVEKAIKTENPNNIIKSWDKITHIKLQNGQLVSMEAYNETFAKIDDKQLSSEVATNSLSYIEGMKSSISQYNDLLVEFSNWKITKEQLVNSEIIKDLLDPNIWELLGIKMSTPPSKEDLTKITEVLDKSHWFMTKVLTMIGAWDVSKAMSIMAENQTLMKVIGTMKMWADTALLSSLMWAGVGSLIMSSSILWPLAWAASVTPAMALLLSLINNSSDNDAKVLINRLHELEWDPNYEYFLAMFGLPWKKRYMSKEFDENMEEVFGKQFNMSLVEQSIIGTLLLVSGKIWITDMYSKKEIESRYWVETRIIEEYVKKNNEVKPYLVEPINDLDEIKELIVTFMYNNLLGQRKMTKGKAKKFFMNELSLDVDLMSKVLTQRPANKEELSDWREYWEGIKKGVNVKWGVKVGNDNIALIKIGGFEYVLRNNHGSKEIRDTVVYRAKWYDILDAILVNSQNANINKAVNVIREVEIDKQEQMQFFVTEHYDKQSIQYEYQHV